MSRTFILNDDDVIQLGDFCRPLDLVYDTYSDYLSTANTYSGYPENHTRWCQVLRLGLEGWVGKTVGDLNRATKYTEFEFCRGDLKPNQILPETEREKERRIDRLKLPKGKYKGKTLGWVRVNDRSYYYWMEAHGLVQRMIDQCDST